MQWIYVEWKNRFLKVDCNFNICNVGMLCRKRWKRTWVRWWHPFGQNQPHVCLSWYLWGDQCSVSYQAASAIFCHAIPVHSRSGYGALTTLELLSWLQPVSFPRCTTYSSANPCGDTSIWLGFHWLELQHWLCPLSLCSKHPNTDQCAP